jgi:hypothetical protein
MPLLPAIFAISFRRLFSCHAAADTLDDAIAIFAITLSADAWLRVMTPGRRR